MRDGVDLHVTGAAGVGEGTKSAGPGDLVGGPTLRRILRDGGDIEREDQRQHQEDKEPERGAGAGRFLPLAGLGRGRDSGETEKSGSDLTRTTSSTSGPGHPGGPGIAAGASQGFLDPRACGRARVSKQPPRRRRRSSRPGPRLPGRLHHPVDHGGGDAAGQGPPAHSRSGPDTSKDPAWRPPVGGLFDGAHPLDGLALLDNPEMFQLLVPEVADR